MRVREWERGPVALRSVYTREYSGDAAFHEGERVVKALCCLYNKGVRCSWERECKGRRASGHHVQKRPRRSKFCEAFQVRVCGQQFKGNRRFSDGKVRTVPRPTALSYREEGSYARRTEWKPGLRRSCQV